jgi:hypothetical protein
LEENLLAEEYTCDACAEKQRLEAGLQAFILRESEQKQDQISQIHAQEHTKNSQAIQLARNAC